MDKNKKRKKQRTKDLELEMRLVNLIMEKPDPVGRFQITKLWDRNVRRYFD